MSSLSLLVDGAASKGDTLEGAIAGCLFALFTKNIQQAVNPPTTVLTVAAFLHASARRFPNLSFITPFPDDLSLYRKLN